MSLYTKVQLKSIVELHTIRAYAYEMIGKLAGQGKITMKWIDIKEAVDSELRERILSDLDMDD